MGRNKKYKTKEQLQEASRRWRRNYYRRNREKCKIERMRRYYEIEKKRVSPKISPKISPEVLRETQARIQEAYIRKYWRYWGAL